METIIFKKGNDDINISHDFENIYTHQWAVWGGKAYSDFVCKKCGITFTHYYHEQPNIFAAIKDAGIDISKCEKK